MKIFISIIAALLFLSGCTHTENKNIPLVQSSAGIISDNPLNNSNMKLGAFSISLSVKDLNTSKAFYEKLGFSVFGGGMNQNYLIMKNGNALVGLFQGMFEGNIMTFNPGWDENAKEIEPFDDVRSIQEQIKSHNLPLESEVENSTTGPGSLMLKDPDGNLILIDQHR